MLLASVAVVIAIVWTKKRRMDEIEDLIGGANDLVEDFDHLAAEPPVRNGEEQPTTPRSSSSARAVVQLDYLQEDLPAKKKAKKMKVVVSENKDRRDSAPAILQWCAHKVVLTAATIGAHV